MYLAKTVTFLARVFQTLKYLIVHAANRGRQRLRPRDPTTLNFDVDTKFIPDNFFKCDVSILTVMLVVLHC